MLSQVIYAEKKNSSWIVSSGLIKILKAQKFAQSFLLVHMSDNCLISSFIINSNPDLKFAFWSRELSSSPQETK